MSEVIAGVIDSIYTKDIAIKNGPRAGTMTKVYHAMVNGHDVNLGFETKHAEGEQVTLNVEHKYGGYQLLKGAPTGTPTPVSVGAGGSGLSAPTVKNTKPAFPIQPNTREMSIVRQSALNRALESVHILMDNNLFSPVDEAAYQNKVLEYAYFYTDFGTGQREVKEAAARAAYDGTE